MSDVGEQVIQKLVEVSARKGDGHRKIGIDVVPTQGDRGVVVNDGYLHFDLRYQNRRSGVSGGG